MSFVAAMSAPDLTKEGVKGSDVYTEAGVGDLRVSFFTQLVRGLSSPIIHTQVKQLLATRNREMIRDLLVIAFQTRDVRGGKGERDLFYDILGEICTLCPQWARDLIALVPEYGCWRDLWVLYTKYPNTQSAIDSVVKEQFVLDQETQHPSLLVKWLPREGSKYSALARHFAALLFPLTPEEKGQRMRTYRRALATLNRFADTTEIKMCGRTWSAITPSRVPGRLMKRCKHAFFNEKKEQARHRDLIVARYPENEDRQRCAQNFRQHIQDVASGKLVMKGATTTMPHEHVHELLYSHGYGLSEDVLSVIQAQWDAIRAETAAAGGLGRVVPMCDFSGSMNGVPKEVSLALGILISEIAAPAFRDCILTFDSEPRWFSFATAGATTLAEKVRSIGGLGQGLSTDFQKAADLILRKLMENKVPREEAPTDLLVLTDMGFDAACSANTYSKYTGNCYTHNTKQKPWETHFQMIHRNFEEAGYEAPRIVCWNLQAEYKDFHATADEIGVVQLSGWSPAVLKAIQGNGVQVETPYQGLRRLLDTPRYDAVRVVGDRLLALTQA